MCIRDRCTREGLSPLQQLILEFDEVLRQPGNAVLLKAASFIHFVSDSALCNRSQNLPAILADGKSFVLEWPPRLRRRRSSRLIEHYRSRGLRRWCRPG